MFKAKFVRRIRSLTASINEGKEERSVREVYKELTELFKHQDAIAVVNEKFKDFHGKYGDENCIKIQITNRVTKEKEVFTLGDKNLILAMLNIEVQEFLQNTFDWYKATKDTKSPRDLDNMIELISNNIKKLVNK